MTSVLLLLILLDQRRGVPESIPGVGTEALANGRQWVTSVSAHETKPGIFRVIAAEIQTKEANFVGNDKACRPRLVESGLTGLAGVVGRGLAGTFCPYRTACAVPLSLVADGNESGSGPQDACLARGHGRYVISGDGNAE